MCHCLQRNFFFVENAKIWVGRTTRNREKKGDGLIRHENRAFRKCLSSPRNLKIAGFAFECFSCFVSLFIYVILKLMLKNPYVRTGVKENNLKTELFENDDAKKKHVINPTPLGCTLTFTL